VKRLAGAQDPPVMMHGERAVGEGLFEEKGGASKVQVRVLLLVGVVEAAAGAAAERAVAQRGESQTHAAAVITKERAVSAAVGAAADRAVVTLKGEVHVHELVGGGVRAVVERVAERVVAHRIVAQRAVA